MDDTFSMLRIHLYPRDFLLHHKSEVEGRLTKARQCIGPERRNLKGLRSGKIEPCINTTSRGSGEFTEFYFG